MNEIDFTKFVILFPTIAAGLLGWFLNRWISNQDKKNEKVDSHAVELSSMKLTIEQIRDAVNRIEAAVERMEDKRERHQEEFIKVKSQVEAAWKAIDRLQTNGRA